MDILTLTTVLFFTFLFPLGETIRFTLGNGIALTPLDIGMIGLLLVWTVRTWITFKFSHPFLKPVTLFIAVCFLSLLANSFSFPVNELLAGSLYIFRFLLYVSIAIVISTSELRKRIIGILLVSGTVMLILGFVQFLFYPQLRNLIYLGWDEHYYRMFGTFLDPNFFGAFLCLFATLTLGMVFDKKTKPKFVLLLLFFATLIGIFLTFSRSSYLMSIVSLVSLLFFLRKRKFILGLIGIGAIFLFFYFVFIKHPKEGMDIFRTTSTFARIGSTASAWNIFIRHPVLGVGFNTYRFAAHQSGLLSNDWLSSHAGAGTDNSFLFVLGTTGIIGFFTYLYLYYCIVKNAWRNKKQFIVSRVLIASIFGLCIDCLFVNSLFFPFLLIWIWSLIGTVE